MSSYETRRLKSRWDFREKENWGGKEMSELRLHQKENKKKKKKKKKKRRKKN